MAGIDFHDPRWWLGLFAVIAGTVAAKFFDHGGYLRGYDAGLAAARDAWGMPKADWDKAFHESPPDRPTPAPGSPFAVPPDVPAIPEFDEKGLRP
jgi:hypothetical protein